MKGINKWLGLQWTQKSGHILQTPQRADKSGNSCEKSYFSILLRFYVPFFCLRFDLSPTGVLKRWSPDVFASNIRRLPLSLGHDGKRMPGTRQSIIHQILMTEQSLRSFENNISWRFGLCECNNPCKLCWEQHLLFVILNRIHIALEARL